MRSKFSLLFSLLVHLSKRGIALEAELGIVAEYRFASLPSHPSDENNVGDEFMANRALIDDLLRFDEVVAATQSCPNMVEEDDGFYCSSRENGFCDQKSGSCICNRGYSGPTCEDCAPTHFKNESRCLEKTLCPGDCNGGGICNYETGLCECFEHRTGANCKRHKCHESFGEEMCRTCNPMTRECHQCIPLYYVNSTGGCSSCSDFDPRCGECDAQNGCTLCVDPLLLSIRRSGRRKFDPILPQDETEREVSADLPFGSQSYRSFEEAEPLFLVFKNSPLHDNSLSCKQRESSADFDCASIEESSHVVCGNLGTFFFDSPTYGVKESARRLEITVGRTGGGVGSVAVDYVLMHESTSPSDVSATCGFTTSQRLHFGEGVIRVTFGIAIFDDSIVETDETFRLQLQNPVCREACINDVPRLGAQSSTRVTILDDDFLALSNSSRSIHESWVAEAGIPFEFIFEALTWTGRNLTTNATSQVSAGFMDSQGVIKTFEGLVPCLRSEGHLYSCTVTPTLSSRDHVVVFHIIPNGLAGSFNCNDALPPIQRTSPTIDFIWNDGPLVDSCKDFVEITWEGAIVLPRDAISSTAILQVESAQLLQMWLDGVRVVDKDENTMIINVTTAFREGINHLKLKYVKKEGSAFLKLSWSIDGDTFVVIPKESLFRWETVDEEKVHVTPGVVSAVASFVSGECLQQAIAVGSLCKIVIHSLDEFGNKQPTLFGKVLRAVLWDETMTAAIFPEISSFEDTHLLLFMPQTSGTNWLNVSIDDISIKDSPLPIEVVPGPPYGPECMITFDSAVPFIAGLPIAVTIRIIDAFGNLVTSWPGSSGIMARAIHTLFPNLQIDAELESSAPGEVEATFVLEQSGDYDFFFSIGCDEAMEPTLDAPCERIQDSPFRMSVIHGLFAIERSKASGLGFSKATSGVPTTFEVILRDNFGNRVTNAPSDLEFDINLRFEDGSEESFHDACVNSSTERYLCTYVPAVAESRAVIEVTLDGNIIQSGEVSITDGSCNGPQSSLVISPVNRAGDALSVIVKARDAAGNVKAEPCSGDVEFAFEDVEIQLGPASFVFEEPGYVLTFNITQAGSFFLNVSLVNKTSGIPIEAVADSPKLVEITPSGVSAENVAVSGDSLTGCAAGEVAELQLVAMDRFNNFIEDIRQVFFKVDVYTNDEKVLEIIPQSSNGNGTFDGSFTPTQAGESYIQTFVAEPEGLEVREYSSIDFDFLMKEGIDPEINYKGEADEQGWGMQWIGLLRIPDEVQEIFVRFSVHGGGVRLWMSGKSLLDEWPFARSSPTSWLSIPNLSPGALIPIEVHFARSQNEFDASLVMEWKYGNVVDMIDRSNFFRWRRINEIMTMVAPSQASAQATRVLGNDTNLLTAGIQKEIVVQVKDRFGNDVSDHSDNLTMVLYDREKLQADLLVQEGAILFDMISPVIDSPGKFRVLFTPRFAGRGLLFVALNKREVHEDFGATEMLESLFESQIYNGPWDVIVSEGLCSPANSEVENLEATAGVPHLVRVFSKDCNGNLRISSTGDLKRVQGNAKSIEVRSDVVGGVYEFEIILTEAGLWPLKIIMCEKEAEIPSVAITVHAAETFAPTTFAEIPASPLKSSFWILIHSMDEFENARSVGGDSFHFKLEIDQKVATQDDRFLLGDSRTDFIERTEDNLNGTYLVEFNFGASFIGSTVALQVLLAKKGGLLGLSFADSAFPNPQAKELSNSVYSAGSAYEGDETANYLRLFGFIKPRFTGKYSFYLNEECDIFRIANHILDVPSSTTSITLRENRLYPIEIGLKLRKDFVFDLEWSHALGTDVDGWYAMPGTVSVVEYSSQAKSTEDLSELVHPGSEIMVGGNLFEVRHYDGPQRMIYLASAFLGGANATAKAYARIERSSVTADNLFHSEKPIKGSPFHLSFI